MRAFATVVKKTALAAVFMTLVPAGGAGIDILGVSIAKADSVSSVVVRGNKRVEAETVRSYVAVKPGRSFSAKEIDDSLKALYATDLFSDVKISREGGALAVTVVESPLINKVAFEGNKRLTDEQLGTVIESKARGFLSKSRVQSDTQRLLEAYRRNGRFRAAVVPKIIQLPDNRVNLVYEVDEGDKTAVSRISFVGNHAFSSGRLRDVIKTRETGLLGWLRTTDTYDPDRLQSDQEALRRYYMKNGYADFRVVSATADLDRERNIFFVTFTVDEGDQYTYGDIDVQTSLSGLDTARLKSAVGTRAGGVYSAEEVEKTMEALVLEASKAGYAFAQVRPRATRDYQGHTIAITYYVEEGQRVYVERINVRGNNRTREYVVRREFDMAEGDAYNRVLVQKAERRLNRLGFFKNVKIGTEPGSQPDRVVVNVDVEEQSTGEIGFGAGYSTTEGVIGDVSYSDRNFLGRGQYIKAAVQYGQYQRGYDFSFTEPYFLGQRISAGFDLYHKQYLVSTYRNYNEETNGGAVRFGLPITDNLTFGASYSLYAQKISLQASDVDMNFDNGEASLAYKTYVCPTYPVGCPTSTGKWSRQVWVSMPSISLTYNTLDNIQFPRDGFYAKLQQDYAGAGGDVAFIRTTFDGRFYKELNADWGLVGMLRLRGGNISGLGKNVRIFDNFFLGGETIRGFASMGIGPRDITRIGSAANGYTSNEALGAKNYVAGSAELMAPFPFTPEEFGLYTAVFADAGTAWGIDKGSLPPSGTIISGTYNGTPFSNGFTYVDDNKIRSSVGFGILWRSPFGPLRADFAVPVTKSRYDRTQVFRFSGGTQF